GDMQSSGERSTYAMALINSIEGEAHKTRVGQLENANRASRGVEEEGEAEQEITS
ncbi:hypothetical protein HAX54_049549, partial [Datura stramonium]|nr:hypothetical protein [Datura stramonium]